MADPRRQAERRRNVEPATRSFEDQFNEETSPVGAELIKDRRTLKKLSGKGLPKPARTRIITVANQKGGVGKTTSAVNVAAGLALGGLNVVVIDSDPQGNASTALGIDHSTGIPSLYDVFMGKMSIADVLQECPDIKNLHVAPSTIDLSTIEISLVLEDKREFRLRDAIAEANLDVDYIIIDCPPSLGLLTLNSLVAAREVLIPIQTEYYALEGLTQLVNTINMVRESANTELEVSTILLTMYDKRTNLARDVAADVREHFPKQTLDVEIPRNVKISEAPSYEQTVLTYDPRSAGGVAYLAAAYEIAHRA
ncbi:ParA family protein [Trueperella pecoris]|uniref:ParA family protein n=1 Tax=Trueperella pecoris TaxID=2733571 RepID=A0A7M1QV38_9ACTO|nr:ParA family protein [Trueperella pecoris]QTG75502.1 ParA family protein [Trueperella pecoris]